MNAHSAQPRGTTGEAVGDSNPGTSPSRLHTRINKPNVVKNLIARPTRITTVEDILAAIGHAANPRPFRRIFQRVGEADHRIDVHIGREPGQSGALLVPLISQFLLLGVPKAFPLHKD